jgi:hypothetical protein
MMGGWMMAGFGILLLLAVGLAVALLLRATPGAGPSSRGLRPRNCWISGMPAARSMTTSTTGAWVCWTPPDR